MVERASLPAAWIVRLSESQTTERDRDRADERMDLVMGCAGGAAIVLVAVCLVASIAGWP